MFNEKEVVYLQYVLGNRFASVEEAKKLVQEGKLIISTTIQEMDIEMSILDSIYKKIEENSDNFRLPELEYLEKTIKTNHTNHVNVYRGMEKGTIKLEESIESIAEKIIMLAELYGKITERMVG